MGLNVAILPVVTKDLPISPRFVEGVMFLFPACSPREYFILHTDFIVVPITVGRGYLYCVPGSTFSNHSSFLRTHIEALKSRCGAFGCRTPVHSINVLVYNS